MLASMAFFEDRFNAIARANGSRSVSIHPSHSLGMSAWANDIGDAHMVIMVPVGALARAIVMHRLLLGYWHCENPTIDVLASIRNPPPVDQRVLPTELVPLLREERCPPEQWWHDLDRLDALVVLPDARLEGDVGELGHLFLSLVLSHEFAHVVRHHAELWPMIDDGSLGRRLAASDEPPPTKVDLERALEVDADIVSTSIVLNTMLIQLQGHPRTDLQRGLLRLGYAITSLLALYDPHRLGLADYDRSDQPSSYLHPAARLQMLVSAAADAAARFGLADLFDAPFDAGTSSCFAALAGVETDILRGNRFTMPGPARSLTVIHALRFGTDTDESVVAALATSARRTWLPVSDLIHETWGSFKLPPPPVGRRRGQRIGAGA
jgi:hypothetical protein